MKRTRRQRYWAARVGLGACLLGSLSSFGCGEEPQQTLYLPFDTQPSCSEPPFACFDADASTLDAGGVKLIYKRIAGHPMVALSVLIDRDPVDAPLRSSLQHWSEAFALDMMFRNGRYQDNSSQWPALWDRLGASFTGSGSSYDYSSLSVEVPLPNWHEAWQLLAGAIEQPYANDYELDFEKSVSGRAYQFELDDPRTAAGVVAWSRLFEHHVYNLGRETQAQMAQVSVATVRAAWNLLRARPRLLAVVVGDVDAEDAVARVSESVGRWASDSSSGAFPKDAVPSPPLDSDVSILKYPGSPTWHISSYFAGPQAGSPDYAPLALGLRVLDQRLFAQVRDERGLAYTVGSGLVFARQTYGSLSLSTDEPNAALPLVAQIIRDLKTSGPRQEELDTEREQLRTGFLSSATTPLGQAGLLASWELTAGDLQSLDALLSGLDSITPADVTAALARYLTGAKTAAAGPGDSVTVDSLRALF
jgi:predicted Zn-dependent peptidase